jgi:hypothetical protein
MHLLVLTVVHIHVSSSKVLLVHRQLYNSYTTYPKTQNKYHNWYDAVTGNAEEIEAAWSMVLIRVISGVLQFEI